MTIIADTDLDLFSHPFANTAATKMLADAFDTLWQTATSGRKARISRIGVSQPYGIRSNFHSGEASSGLGART